MGITINDVRFLLHARREGASFKLTLTLGRLQWFVKSPAFAEVMKAHGLDAGALPANAFASGYSEAFFSLLGAERADSMDLSDYEGATVLHDLNRPLPQQLKGTYTAVIDGGTLEHVFNFPAAIRNCMELVAEGGHFLGCGPANNQMGHGFYQFSPELWFRVFSPENGFKIVRLLVFSHAGGDDYGTWYEVADPQEVRDRVTLTNALPTYLLIMARRVEIKELFTTTPQQSDYQSTWARVKVEKASDGGSAGPVAKWYRALVPRSLRDRIYQLRRNARPSVRTDDLGDLAAKHFKRFDPGLIPLPDALDLGTTAAPVIAPG